MKWIGYRVCSLWLVPLFSLTIPAAAGQLNPIITHVVFSKDGAPNNGSVHVIVKCSGYKDTSWMPRTMSVREKLSSDGEEVCSSTATCPEYGCNIHEPCYLNYRVIESCDREVETGGGDFILRNYTHNPRPADCTAIHPYTVGNGENRYYHETPAYRECLNASYRAQKLSNELVVECNPAQDGDCKTRISSGRLVRETVRSRVYPEEAGRQREACDRCLQEMDPKTMITGEDPFTIFDQPARRECNARFTIPSGNEKPEVSPSYGMPVGKGNPVPGMIYGTRATAVAHSFDPTGTLCCSILRFFGGRC